jgi:adenosylcobinamide-phosphate synthase
MLNPDLTLPLLLIALIVEALVGWPQPLYRVIRHPVVWIGALIGFMERQMNGATMPERTKRGNGVVALIALLAAVLVGAFAVQLALLVFLPAWAALLGIALVTSTFLAQRSLHGHVQDVAKGLEKNGLEGGRKAVSHIVGRNPDSLDEAGVARAAIESLAENFSDGVVAPAFWAALGGLPGIAAYKAVNTADSMIGHKTPRYKSFGWAAARFDDLVNLPGSRLAAFWIILAALFNGKDVVGAIKATRRDAARHRSPNAGWPEAAMAGALGLALGGPRIYGQERVEDHWMGNGRQAASAADIRAALSLYRTACLLQMLAIAALGAWVTGQL